MLYCTFSHCNAIYCLALYPTPDVSALVVSVLDGYNVCIFAYGQTGSGEGFIIVTAVMIMTIICMSFSIAYFTYLEHLFDYLKSPSII